MAVRADDDRIWVEAELPGLSDRDVEITVHKGTLFIGGERRPEEGRKYLDNGPAFGRFERAIALPEAGDAGAVRATLKDGVLLVELPKSPAAKPRKVELRVG